MHWLTVCVKMMRFWAINRRYSTLPTKTIPFFYIVYWHFKSASNAQLCVLFNFILNDQGQEFKYLM